MFSQPKFRWFQCSVGDNFDKNFRNPEGYIENNDINYENINENVNNNETVKYSFFGRSYNGSFWFSDINVLISLARYLF